MLRTLSRQLALLLASLVSSAALMAVVINLDAAVRRPADLQAGAAAPQTAGVEDDCNAEPSGPARVACRVAATF